MTTAPTATHPGQTRITAHALHRVTAAAAAEALHVAARDVHVVLRDSAGSLVAAVSAPVATRPLAEVPATAPDARSTATPDAVTTDAAAPAASGTLLDRLAAARTAMTERVRTVTGSRIGALDLRITGVRPTPTETRVR